MGDAHPRFPLRTELTDHWMSLLLQTNTLNNLFKTSNKKSVFSVWKAQNVLPEDTEPFTSPPAALPFPGTPLGAEGLGAGGLAWGGHDPLRPLCPSRELLRYLCIHGGDIMAVPVAIEKGTAIPEG